jgi:putative ABC transport system substrate-binding protein
MKRREFITILGGVAVAWPLAARAQQPQMRRVGALILGNADAEAFGKEMREGLSKAGYIEGRNVLFDIRSAQGRHDLLPKLATELVAEKVDVLVALYTPCARAAQQATRDVPIVAIVANPVETGIIASLARPGGNITGVSLMAAEAHGKCVEVFGDMLPSVRKVAALGKCQ